MPRTTREWALRKLDMAVGNLETNQRHLAEFINRYIEDHPELADPAITVVEATDLLIETIRKLRGII